MTKVQSQSVTSVGFLITVVACLKFYLQVKETRLPLTTTSMATNAQP